MAQSVMRPRFQSRGSAVGLQEIAQILRANFAGPSGVRFEPRGEVRLDLHEPTRGGLSLECRNLNQLLSEMNIFPFQASYLGPPQASERTQKPVRQGFLSSRLQQLRQLFRGEYPNWRTTGPRLLDLCDRIF